MSPTASRIALGTAALVVVALVVGIVMLGRLGRLVEHAIETYGPPLTGTTVTLDEAELSVFSGAGELEDLRIGNPEGYATDYAFDLDQVAVEVDLGSLGGEVVRVRSLVIDGPRLIAEFDAGGGSNLKAILDQVKSAGRQRPRRSSDGDEAPPPRLIIERFRFVNAELRALAEPFGLDKQLKLKPIELKNLGARQGGATASEIGQQILRPVIEQALKAARDEYLQARRAELEQKAQDEARGLLEGLFE